LFETGVEGDFKGVLKGLFFFCEGGGLVFEAGLEVLELVLEGLDLGLGICEIGFE
jgi:hypothetical protein